MTRCRRLGPGELRAGPRRPGATLLDLVHGDAERAGEIGGGWSSTTRSTLVLHARCARPRRRGVESPERGRALLAIFGTARRCAGLVLRAPGAATAGGPAPTAPGSSSSAEPWAPWAHRAAVLRSLLAEGDVGVAGEESLGGLRRVTSCSPSRTRSRPCSTP